MGVKTQGGTSMPREAFLAIVTSFIPRKLRFASVLRGVYLANSRAKATGSVVANATMSELK